MSTYKFEVANWQNEGARDLAKESFQAQAAALNKTADEPDLTTFNAMADAIDTMVTALGVVGSPYTIYVSAQAESQDSGELSINIGIRLTPQ